MSAITRRSFLGSITLPAGLAASGLAGCSSPTLSNRAGRGLESLRSAPHEPDAQARDEDFWGPVQQAFTADRSLVNFNNGGVSPSPRVVQEAMKRHLDYSNTATAYTMWRILEPQREAVRQRVAAHWGVDAEEIAFTRNSSESLQICQQGFDLKPGDEILTTTLDYPRMLTTFRQMERRIGVKLNLVKIPIPCEDDGEIVRRFEGGLTPRTRLVLMSHIINITGQILPVKRVVEMARAKGDRAGGIPVIVDGAHALAHFPFKISDLGCDYYGVSLHKWLAAPHGTGLLYVRRDKIKALWPMMAAGPEQDENIRKFEEVGTHPAANWLAIGDALTFHQAIGDERKAARLRHLRDTWAKRLLNAGKGRVRLHTSLDPRFSCGIGVVQIDGVESVKFVDHLFEKHRIITTGIKHDEFEGVRVTPSVYSTMEEVDRFCEATERVIAHGLPG